MVEPPHPPGEPPDARIEVRYSPKMQAQRARETRRVALLGGPGLMLMGIIIVIADGRAIRRHSLVHSGPTTGLLISPWFELPMGLLAIYFGWLLLRSHFKSR